MAGFDELIERLLCDVALAGSQGLSAAQFENAVKTFYDEKNANTTATAPTTGDDLLFSDAPPTEKTTVDDALLGTILEWLSKYQDVQIQDDGNSIPAQNKDQSTDDTASTSAFRSRLAGKHIITSEDRVWNAIAGHGADHKRVPPLEFAILSVVAAHGPDGILQPYVTKLTGQDKRSVPKRTDALAEKGYIIKDTVIGSGQKTSVLRLTRYAASSNTVTPRAEPGSALGSRPVIFYNTWFDETMTLLRSNNNMVTMKDLRLQLGISLDSWARKVLIRCVRRLGDGGCVRRLTAKILDSDGNPMPLNAQGKERRAKALQLVREPTQYDRMLWSQSDPHKKLPKERDESSEDDEFVDISTTSDGDDGAASDEEGELVEFDDGLDELENMEEPAPPQWTPEMPLNNLVFNTVQAGGQQGLHSRQVNGLVTGSLFRRPLDEVMLRLTDVPLHSQPAHLRHLTLVREHSVVNRVSCYNFRTIENFEKAVEAGEADAQPKIGSNATGKQNVVQPNLDAWGFPKVTLKELAGRDGRATLAEGRKGLAVGSLRATDEPKTSQSKHAADPERTPLEKSTQVTPKSKGGRPKANKQTTSKSADTTTAGAEKPSSASFGKRKRSQSEITPTNAEEPTQDTPRQKRSRTQDTLSASATNSQSTAQVQSLFDHIETQASAIFLPINGWQPSTGGTTTPKPSTLTAPLAQLVANDDFAKPAAPASGFGVLRPVPVRGQTRKSKHAQKETAKQNKKREIPREEYEEFEAAAQTLAEQRVMAEIKASKKRDREAAGLDNFDDQFQDININDLPQERVARIKADIVAREKPGIYINPPGARSLKKESAVKRGRPRNALIAVVKSDRLKPLPWFKDGSPTVAASSAGPPAAMMGRYQLENAGSALETDNLPPKRRRISGPIDGNMEQPETAIEIENIFPEESLYHETPAGISPAPERPIREPFVGETDAAPTAPIVPAAQINLEPAAISTPDRPSFQNTVANESLAKPQAGSNVIFPVNVVATSPVTEQAGSKDTMSISANIQSRLSESRLDPAQQPLGDVPDGSRKQDPVPSHNGKDPISTSSTEPAFVEPTFTQTPTTPRRHGYAEAQALANVRAGTKSRPRGSILSIASSEVPKEIFKVPQKIVKASPKPRPERKKTENEDLFKTEYVDKHPNETFYHRGKGYWARGTPPGDVLAAYASRTGVRGPGAKMYKDAVDQARKNAARRSAPSAAISRLAGNPPSEMATLPDAEDITDAAETVGPVDESNDIALDSTALQTSNSNVAGSPRIPVPELSGTAIDGTASRQEIALTVPQSPASPRIAPEQEVVQIAIAPEAVRPTSEGTSINRPVPAAEETAQPTSSSDVPPVSAVESGNLMESTDITNDKHLPQVNMSVQTPAKSKEVARSVTSTSQQQALPEPSTTENSSKDTDFEALKAVLFDPITTPSTLGTTQVSYPKPKTVPFPQRHVYRPQDLVTRDYVDQHPNETFNHRGGGRWARGLPPPGTLKTQKIAVVGPGAEQWKLEHGVGQPASGTPRQARKSSRKDKLIVKLPIPSAKLRSKALAQSQMPASSRNEAALPTPPRGDLTSKSARVGTSPPVQDQSTMDAATGLATNTSKTTKNPLLQIVRPYSQSTQMPALAPQFPSVQDATSSDLIVSTQPSQESAPPQTEPSLPKAGPAVESIDSPTPQQHEDQDTTGASAAAPFEPHQPSKTPYLPMVGTATKSANIVKAERQQIIINAVRACGGVFPGNGEICYVIATASRKLYHTVPDGDAVEDALKRLLGLKLRKLAFQFRNKKGETIRRFILTEVGVDPTSLAVKKVQKKIIDTHPLLYLPLEAEIDEEMRLRANSKFAPVPGTNMETAFDRDSVAAVRLTPQSLLLEQAVPSRERSAPVRRGQKRNSTREPPTARGPKRRRSEIDVAPISTITGTQSKNQTRRSRDVDGDLTLDDLARFHRRAASLLLHPEQTFTVPTGTFSTSGIAAVEATPDYRTLRGRASIFNVASHSVLEDVDEFLAQAAEEHDASTDSDFELDDDESEIDESAQSSFIVKLKAPSLGLQKRQSTVTSTQPTQVAIPQPAAETSNLTPAGRPKRKYKSRIKPAVVNEGLRESDDEFVPEPEELRRRAVKDPYSTGVGPRRDRKSGAAFKDGDRVVIAVALMSALCGGISPERLNWTLVAHALSFRYDSEFLRRRWASLRHTRKNDVEKLRNALREPFLQAYEKNELPRVDFQDLSHTDWPALFEWVENTVVPMKPEQYSPNGYQLPESREDLDMDITVEDETPIYQLKRSDYFTTHTDLNRKHLAMRYVNVLATESKKQTDDLIVLKSWIRAIATTKQYNYIAEAAVQKIKSCFTESEVEKGLADLSEAHILSQEKKGRQLPGRNYHIHNEVLAQFKRWPAKPEEHKYLRQVASAYQVINAHFKQYDQLQLNPAASDPEYLVLTNMVAQGWLRVKTVFPQRNDDINAPGPKLSMWGYNGGHYETKKLDISLLKFPVVYVKTAAYPENHGLKEDVPMPTQLVTNQGDKGVRTPFWIDIHGSFIDDIWDMLLRSVIHLVVFRPGSTAAQMASAHADKLWEWEIELLLQWMEQVGIAVRCGAGKEENGVWKGGWRAGPAWFCTFVQEIAKWKAPGGVDFGV